MTEIDITGLRVLAQAATPGPWDVQTEWHDDGPEQCCIVFGEGVDWVAQTPGWFADSAKDHNDAAFIAAANPATVLALCDALDEQAREIERLREALNEIRIRARMGKDNDSVTGMILGDLERYAVAVLSEASTEALGGEA